jgi:hypothetical protein
MMAVTLVVVMMGVTLVVIMKTTTKVEEKLTNNNKVTGK